MRSLINRVLSCTIIICFLLCLLGVSFCDQVIRQDKNPVLESNPEVVPQAEKVEDPEIPTVERTTIGRMATPSMDLIVEDTIKSFDEYETSQKTELGSETESETETTEETGWRSNLAEMISKFDGMGHYSFGSKPDASDVENAILYLDGTLSKEDLDLQLDCSGFVELINWIWTGSYDESVASTYLIAKSCESITAEELQPGDLGLIFADGTYYDTSDGHRYYEYSSVKQWLSEDSSRTKDDVTAHVNHVGIFMGYDEDGSMIWAHCNARTNGITVNHTSMFHCFYNRAGKTP